MARSVTGRIGEPSSDSGAVDRKKAGTSRTTARGTGRGRDRAFCLYAFARLTSDGRMGARGKTSTKSKKGGNQTRVLPGSLGIGVETARKLLQLLNDAGLSGHHRLAILNADGKGKAVANNRDPLFFDDLIPSNYRREGIWQRSLNAFVESEPTSATARRDVYATPAGLTNLGSTCYANSALQVLYTNKVFRACLLYTSDAADE